MAFGVGERRALLRHVGRVTEQMYGNVFANDFWMGKGLCCALLYLNDRVLTLDTRRQALLLDVDDEIL